MSLALTLSAIDLLIEKTGEAPILLLDDVESELDQQRKKALYDLLSSFECQVLVSTTEVGEQLNTLSDDSGFFSIKDGRIEALEKGKKSP
jgi:DNA replication and repair protein RecF